jgi:SAM-dependent methyltransferase
MRADFHWELQPAEAALSNPWLEIPLADYEGHMALPTVGQSQLIADELEVLVRAHAPTSVAVIGCAGGNGFDRLGGVTRVVGVDINPAYIERARERHAGAEFHVADIESVGLLFEPVDLVYVALVLEYVDPGRAMRVLGRHCRPGAVLAVLSQLPHEAIAHVTPSPYTSLRKLGMRLVAPEAIQEQARLGGFVHERTRIVAASGGKQFSVTEFRLPH